MTTTTLETRKGPEIKSQEDSSWKSLYKIGGVAALIEGVAYLMITAMGPMMGVAPGNSITWLNALAAHPQLAIINYGLVTGIADFALIPIALAMYFALRGVSKSWMLVAASTVLVFVAIDIPTFVFTSINLTWLTQNFASATDPVVRTAILGAEYSLLSTIPLTQFVGWSLWPIIFVIWIVGLFKSKLPFSRFVRIFGIFTVFFSIAGFSFLYPSVTYLQNLQLPALTVYGLFFLGLSAMLLRLGGRNLQPIYTTSSEFARKESREDRIEERLRRFRLVDEHITVSSFKAAIPNFSLKIYSHFLQE